MEPKSHRRINRALDGRGTQVPGALGVLLWQLCLHSGIGRSLAVEALGLSSVWAGALQWNHEGDGDRAGLLVGLIRP